MAVRSPAEVPIYSGLSYREYLKLPSDEHQWILKDTALRVDRFVSGSGLGIVLFAPLDVVIRRLPRLRTRQPDLVFYAAQTIGGTSRAALRNARERDLAPDLAVEIFSSSEHRQAVAAKLRDYAAIGIQEVWQIDPAIRTIVVLRLEGDRYGEMARFGENDQLVSELLPGFSLPVAEVFE